MKKFLLAALLMSSLGLAQEPANPNIPQYVRDIRSLPEEQLKNYSELNQRATMLFGQKRIFECLETIDKLEDIYSGNPSIHNLKGACYVEFRAFDKARKAFAEAAKIQPGDVNVKFNLAEIDFVTQKYPQALEQFEELLKPEQSEKLAPAMTRLITFKALLTKLKLGDREGSKKYLEGIDYLSDSPLYYFGNAALAYHADEKIEAERWLARANRVFKSNQILAPWQDTLIEFGYIKSFYGNDSGEE